MHIALWPKEGITLWMIANQTFGLTARGLVAGLPAGSWAIRFLSSLLVRVTPTDLPTFVETAALFALLALAARFSRLVAS